MNLPNYFIADLPGNAAPSVTLLREACSALKRNRDQYLASRTTRTLLNTICRVAENWLDPNYPLRQMALSQGPAWTGFSAATLSRGLDGFFKELTYENLSALLIQDLGHPERLDQMVSTPLEMKAGRAAMAVSPRFIVQIVSGNIPNPALFSITLGLILRSAQFVKCGSGASFLPRLFAHSIYEADPKLGACIELAEFPGGTFALEEVLFEEADCVTATGGNEALGSIRQRLPSRTRLVEHGHRVSFAYVSGDVLTGLNELKVVARAAADVVAWNQLGCLSPHVIYVEQEGGLSPECFAELLAKKLDELESSEPRGELPVREAAAINSRRSIYELRAAAAPDTRVWASRNSTAWTVVYEGNSRFQASCLNRFIYVKPVANLTEMLHGADAIRESVSTVGIAAPDHKYHEIATQLAHWGATRVCPLGRMQQPPLLWRHDGRGPLAELITWADCETL